MSDSTTSSEVMTDVANDVVDEVDVGSLLTGDDDVMDDVDGESLGRSVGETVGEALGRLLGRSVVDWLLSKLTFWDDDDPSLSSRLGRSLLVALGRTLRKPEFREPVGDALRGVIDQLEARQEAATDAAEDAASEASDEATEAADAAAETAEETTDAVSEKASEAVEALESGEMDELRKETYRELLEMMEYSQLQSIAKEAGVKANQEREEMIDAIVDRFDPDEGDEGGSDDE